MGAGAGVANWAELAKRGADAAPGDTAGAAALEGAPVGVHATSNKTAAAVHNLTRSGTVTCWQGEPQCRA